MWRGVKRSVPGVLVQPEQKCEAMSERRQIVPFIQIMLTLKPNGGYLKVSIAVRDKGRLRQGRMVAAGGRSDQRALRDG